MAQPDLNAFFDQLCSRYAWDFGALSFWPGVTTGAAWQSNPPYGLSDFYMLYPKFAGQPTMVTGTETASSAVITGLASTAWMGPGQIVAGTGLPANTTIVTVDSSTQITLSNPATGTGAQTLAVFMSPLLPAPVVSIYIALAASSIMQQRWQSAWTVAMGLFVAHFCTLWLRSDGGVYNTTGAAAAAGLAQGIKTSKSVGPLSVGISLATGLEQWGAWNETEYGVQLATMARVIGMGPIYVR